METEIKTINNDLNDALAKLINSRSNSKCTGGALEERKRKIASLIRMHIRNLQNTVVTCRRRRQERTRRRFKQLRSFFMQQVIELQSNYFEMFAMLRMKHIQLQQEEEVEEEEEEEEDMLMSSASDSSDDSPARAVHVTQFWEDTIPLFNDEEFLNSFHVTRSTFESLCSQLAPTLRSVPELTSSAVDPISPDKCVGLALYFLASGDRVSIISEQFSLPRARTIKCLKVFCNAVMSSLGKALRMLPQSEADCENVVAGFHKECNMPEALMGVLGVCCIPLRGRAKQEGGAAPVLRMEFLLDDRMLFRELQLGNGTKSPLPPMFADEPNTLTELPTRCINRRQVPAFVLAPNNQNYPLRQWLLQQYSDPVAPHEYDFNEVAEHLHELSDCALHRLMSRWRFLSQPLDISYQTASCIITAATVLHNLLEELSEPHMLEWGNSVDVSRFRPPPIASKPDTSKDAERGAEVRNFLARTISSTEM